MPKEKPCKICNVKKLPYELDEKGRCPSCQDAHKADLSLMSYGKWMARFKPPKQKQEAQEEKKQPVIDESIIIPGLYCQVCGKPIPLGAHSTVTCGDAECKYKRQLQANVVWHRKRREETAAEREPIECACCHKIFVPNGYQRKTCSKECSAKYALERRRHNSKMSAIRAKAKRSATRGEPA